MKINGIVFGAITIDGKTYKHDVVVRLSGEVVKRKKKLSKRLFGSSHMLSEDEGKFLFEKGCDQVVIGSGQMCNVHLSPEAEAYFERKGCEALLKPTPEAIRNRARLRKRTRIRIQHHRHQRVYHRRQWPFDFVGDRRRRVRADRLGVPNRPQHGCRPVVVGRGRSRCLLIRGSQVRALVRPPPSLPKTATDSSLVESPPLRPIFAFGGLRFPVSAQR